VIIAAVCGKTRGREKGNPDGNPGVAENDVKNVSNINVVGRRLFRRSKIFSGNG
jgi:hypothetical protein